MKLDAFPSFKLAAEAATSIRKSLSDGSIKLFDTYGNVISFDADVYLTHIYVSPTHTGGNEFNLFVEKFESPHSKTPYSVQEIDRIISA